MKPKELDWEKEFDSRDLGCCGGDNCPHYVCRYDEKTGNNVGTNHNEVLKDFISQLLKTQREEIVSEIEGIVGVDTGGTGQVYFYKNQLRKEIRERLLLIKNK